MTLLLGLYNMTLSCC